MKMEMENIGNNMQKKIVLKRLVAFWLVFFLVAIIVPHSTLAQSPGTAPPPLSRKALQQPIQITPTLYEYKFNSQLPIRSSWVLKFNEYRKDQKPLKQLKYREIDPNDKTKNIGEQRSADVIPIARFPHLVRLIIFPFIDDNDDNMEKVKDFFDSKDIQAKLARLQKDGMQISVYHYPTQRLENWTPGFSSALLLKTIEETPDVDGKSFQQTISQLLQQTESVSISKNKEFLHKPIVITLWADSSDNPVKTKSAPKPSATNNTNTSVIVLNIEKKQGLLGGSGLVGGMKEFCNQNIFTYHEVDISSMASKIPVERSYKIFDKALANMFTVPPLHSIITLESQYESIALSRIFELSWWGREKTLHIPLTSSLYNMTTAKVFNDFEATLNKRNYRKLDPIYLKLVSTDYASQAVKKFQKFIGNELKFALKKERFKQAMGLYNTTRNSQIPSSSFSKQMKKDIEKKMGKSFHAKLAENAFVPAEKQLDSFRALLSGKNVFLDKLDQDLSKAKQKNDANTWTSELLKLEDEKKYSAAEETINKLSSNPYANTKKIHAIDVRIKNKKLYDQGIAALNKGDLTVGIPTIVKWQKEQAKSGSEKELELTDVAYKLIFQKVLAQDQNVDKLMVEHISRISQGNPEHLASYYPYIGEWLSAEGTDQSHLVKKIALLPQFTIAQKSLDAVQAQGEIVRMLDLTIGKSKKSVDLFEARYLATEGLEDLNSAFLDYISIVRAHSFLAVTKVLSLFALESPDISGEKFIKSLASINEDPVLEGWSDNVSWSLLQKEEVSPFLSDTIVKLASQSGINLILEDNSPDYNYFLLLPNKEIIKFHLTGIPTQEEANQFTLLSTDDSRERSYHLKVFSAMEYQKSTLASIALVAKLTSSYGGSKPEELIKNATSRSIPQGVLKYLMVLTVGEEDKIERLYVQPSSTDEATINNSQYNQAELSFVISSPGTTEMGVPYSKVNSNQESLFDIEKIGIIRAGFINYIE